MMILRPAMTGVYFELNKDAIQFVATDAHRLVRYRRTDVHCPMQDSFIVPKKPLISCVMLCPTMKMKLPSATTVITFL